MYSGVLSLPKNTEHLPLFRERGSQNLSWTARDRNSSLADHGEGREGKEAKARRVLCWRCIVNTWVKESYYFAVPNLDERDQ